MACENFKMGRSREFITEGDTFYDVDVLGEEAFRKRIRAVSQDWKFRKRFLKRLFRKLIFSPFLGMAVKANGSPV